MKGNMRNSEDAEGNGLPDMADVKERLAALSPEEVLAFRPSPALQNLHQ